MFNTQSLRKAIAEFSPGQYSFWTWKRLLPDFVDMHIQAYLTLRDRYEQRRTLDPSATPPPLRAELKQAVTLLAKEESHSYEYLALSFYVLQWEVAALTRENEHLRQQAAGHEQLMIGYQQLASQAIASLDNTDNI
jgi:hypothetical protein